ncbi:low temperature requirement protein A [Streptomyces sp. NPDC002838]|uniref:low temperature requirement protein A n=1 Tax=Streptomyces sp. NPDC002838 TaxID=3154436 RepID=UPI00333267A9
MVYVFTLTQITEYMAHEHTGAGALRGMLLLALVWFSWSAYAWLGNQARTDLAVVRVGMALAMAGVFVVALAVPESWHDLSGGLHGPLVLACAYLFVRSVHLFLYSGLARGDHGLMRQIAVSWPPVLGGSALLIAGTVVGGRWQTALFAAAIAVDWGGVYATSRRGSWRIHSAAYFAERHQLFVIIAIGESLLAMGAGSVGHPVSTPLLAAGVLGVATATGLWWLYFDLATHIGERQLDKAHGQARLTLAVHAYGYAHFPITAGIVVTALGVEGVVAHADDGNSLGTFYAWALCGGAALYVGGLLLFGRIMLKVWGGFRLTALCLFLAGVPAAAVVHRWPPWPASSSSWRRWPRRRRGGTRSCAAASCERTAEEVCRSPGRPAPAQRWVGGRPLWLHACVGDVIDAHTRSPTRRRGISRCRTTSGWRAGAALRGPSPPCPGDGGHALEDMCFEPAMYLWSAGSRRASRSTSRDVSRRSSRSRCPSASSAAASCSPGRPRHASSARVLHALGEEMPPRSLRRSSTADSRRRCTSTGPGPRRWRWTPRRPGGTCRC